MPCIYFFNLGDIAFRFANHIQRQMQKSQNIILDNPTEASTIVVSDINQV